MPSFTVAAARFASPTPPAAFRQPVACPPVLFWPRLPRRREASSRRRRPPSRRCRRCRRFFAAAAARTPLTGY